jgi:methyl-accepting chemotaxis protein
VDAQTIARVRASWSQVQPIRSAAAALFYRHLFSDAPGLRALFRGDLQEQGDRLMQMMDWLVDRLDDPPTLLAALADLGRRHAGYGVQASHYDRVGTALLRTLADGLGAQFTAATERAWTELYEVMADAMIAPLTEETVAQAPTVRGVASLAAGSGR